MELLKKIICTECKHFDQDNFVNGLYCKAFPEGIPDEIATGEFEHTTYYQGDNGIIFEKV